MARITSERLGGDEGGIVLGWLTKLAVVLAIVGVMVFDLLSVVTAKMQVADQGAAAAMTASDTWLRTHDARQTLESAEQAVSGSNPLNSLDESTFRIDPDGTVYVRVSREAPTLVAKYIKPLRELSVVQADSHGRSAA